jgi:hypothetical protein
VSKKKSSQPRQRNGHAPARRAKGLLVGHIFPVHPTSGTDARPEGWLLCATPEEGDVVALPPLDRVLLEMPKKLRARLANGVWWLSDDRFDLDNTQGLIADAAQDEDWQDLQFCDDCLIADGGKGCGALGSIEDRGFAAREPPPPALDGEDVAEMAQMLLEADEDGLAFELMQAALARFCALKPRSQGSLEVRMTLKEAAAVLGLELPCNQAAVESAFRNAVKQHHPDAGGDPEEMKRVLEAKRRMDAMQVSRDDDADANETAEVEA